MKLIVMGPPLSGKTTLALHLRSLNTELRIADFDEEILALNNGVWPAHDSDELIGYDSITFENILTKDNVIFMTYEQPMSRIIRAKELGFKVIQLIADYPELERRNFERIKLHPHNDAFQFVPKNLAQQRINHGSGLVDVCIDATLPTQKIAQDLLTLRQ